MTACSKTLPVLCIAYALHAFAHNDSWKQHQRCTVRHVQLHEDRAGRARQGGAGQAGPGRAGQGRQRRALLNLQPVIHKQYHSSACCSHTTQHPPLPVTACHFALKQVQIPHSESSSQGIPVLHAQRAVHKGQHQTQGDAKSHRHPKGVCMVAGKP